MHYKAHIYFSATEDVYEEGEIGGVSNEWDTVLTAKTQSELRDKVLEATYSDWGSLNDEQMNGYDWCTEYSTSYLADEDNEGQASDDQVEQWKLGKCRLWGVYCHILVTQVKEAKASL